MTDVEYAIRVSDEPFSGIYWRDGQLVCCVSGVDSTPEALAAHVGWDVVEILGHMARMRRERAAEV